MLADIELVLFENSPVNVTVQRSMSLDLRAMRACSCCNKAAATLFWAQAT
jgi:hypothetical protein